MTAPWSSGYVLAAGCYLPLPKYGDWLGAGTWTLGRFGMSGELRRHHHRCIRKKPNCISGWRRIPGYSASFPSTSEKMPTKLLVRPSPEELPGEKFGFEEEEMKKKNITEQAFDNNHLWHRRGGGDPPFYFIVAKDQR